MKMNKIKEALSKLIAETFERVSTDKGILALDGALEDIAVGMGVSYVTEEGEEVAAENGDYVLEDGRIIRVDDGKITEIIEPEPEVEETPAEEEVEVETEENEEPEVENPTNEGEESETEAVVKLREEVNELYELVHRLEERIAELEKKPAAEPASEEFKKTKTDKFSETKDAHKNFLADVLKA